jgi:transposase
MVLRDDQWERIAPLIPGKVGDPGRSGSDNRLFVEAVLWIVRVGAPWRDLPEYFGNWNSVFQRFRRWAKGEVFEKIFDALSADADFEYVIVDGTIVRVHQHGTGQKKLWGERRGLRHHRCADNDGGAPWPSLTICPNPSSLSSMIARWCA